MVKVRKIKNGFDYYREKSVEPNWLFQAHLAGIRQFRLAHFNDSAMVTRPIETIQIADLLKVNILTIIYVNSIAIHDFVIAET